MKFPTIFLLNIAITNKQVTIFSRKKMSRNHMEKNMKFTLLPHSKENAIMHNCPFSKATVSHLQKQCGRGLKATY